MSKASKTARASMVTGPVTKAVISDEVYVKNLRYDLANGLYVAQEGARALLRTYDLLVNAHASMGAQLHDALENNKQLREELLKASDVITKLNAEIAGVRAALEGPDA